MTTCADWKAALHANPHDPSLWDDVADWLSKGNEWEREKCGCDNGKKSTVLYDSNNPHYRGQMISTCSLCHGSGSLPAMTAHLARLTAWRLRMEDERWHGVEQQTHAFFKSPTFALLWDREKPCPDCEGEGYYVDALMLRRRCLTCLGARRLIVPGHVSELAAYMESQGDAEAAERVRGIRVERASVAGGWEGWKVLPAPRGVGSFFTATHPDACREAIRRVCSVFTEECENCNFDGRFYTEPRGHPILSARKICTICFGLGWRATEEKRG